MDIPPEPVAAAHGTHNAGDPRNAQVLINVNGRLVPRGQAVVSVFDAGFVLGDGVWEGLRVSAGCSAAAPGSRPSHPRRTCTICASGARSCATCWRSSLPCSTRAAAAARSKSSRPCRTCWGRSQDSEEQRDAIYALASDMMVGGDADSRTMLAMGEIAARLQESMQASRAEFAATFSSFGRLSVPRRMARLAPAPAGAGAAGAAGAAG